MSEFSCLAVADRAQYVEEAAARRGVSPVVVEKDAWVSWALRELFSDPLLSSQMLFKGGTSLSKVYGMIDRFSEDIYLGVQPPGLGYDAARIRESMSTKSRRLALLGAMQEACGRFVQDNIRPLLEAAARAQCGHPAAGGWFSLDVEDRYGTTLLFEYPQAVPATAAYIAKAIRLEFGALTNQQPLAPLPIRSLLGDALGEKFADLECSVTTLGVERTFWEKATILHDCARMPLSKPLRPRYARHYSDFADLWHKRGAGWIRNRGLLEDVAHHKAQFFSSSWSDYEVSASGGMKLVPPVPRHTELHADYKAMLPMFLSQPRPFAEILAALTEAEALVNSSA